MSIKNITNFSATILAEAAYATLRQYANLVVFENRSYSKITVSDENHDFFITKDLHQLLLKDVIPSREEFPKRYFLDLDGNICEFCFEVQQELSNLASAKMNSKVVAVPYYAIVDSKTDTALLSFDPRYVCGDEVEMEELVVKVHTTAYQFWIR